MPVHKQPQQNTRTEPIKACLISNPTSGQEDADLLRVEQILAEHGWDVDVQQTRYARHATELTQRAAQVGFDVIVACGGDGTLNEVVEGALGTEIAVGVIPCGTANVWAHELGIAMDIEAASHQLLQARSHRIDVGRVVIGPLPMSNKKASAKQVRGQQRHFLLMAGMGFDGTVLENVSSALKKNLGPVAVGVAAIQALPSFEPAAVTLMCYAKTGAEIARWSGDVAQIVIGNTRQYAGFAEMTDHAYADDGMLDACLITASSPLDVMQQLGTLLVMQRPGKENAEFYRAAAISIQAKKPLPLQIDGEVLPTPPQTDSQSAASYSFSSLHQAISVLVPKEYQGPLFQRSTSERR